MKIGIMQPTYMPWIGYFDMIDQVGMFVLLDHVQFSKQSWQQRNQIKTPKGLEWLTVPVEVKGKSRQSILDVQIQSAHFVNKHVRALQMHYRQAAHGPAVTEEFARLLQRDPPWDRLVELNVALIGWMCARLGITTPVVRSSTLSPQGKRTEALVSICEQLGATSYLATLGSATYLLGDLHSFEDRGLPVTFHHYVHPTYTQMYPPFVPYASAIDLICNEGPNALSVVRSGRRPDLAPAAALQMTVFGQGSAETILDRGQHT
jgi:WbqC-like protein family